MQRQKLTNRRGSEHLLFEFNNAKYNLSLSEFPDGRLGELWIDGAKTGTDLWYIMIELATVASIALQRGATPEEICRSLPQTRSGLPLGPLGCALKEVKEQSSAGTNSRS